MKLSFKYIILTFILLLSFACKKEVEKYDFDNRGRVIKLCSIRAGDGRGPYEPLGNVHFKKCQSKISKLCNKKKFKQIHRTKGHFARGKFGKKIVIGLCP